MGGKEKLGKKGGKNRKEWAKEKVKINGKN